MIVTLTANTTIDQTLYVPEMTLNRTLRATKTVQSMAGKPTDASWILGEIGIPSLALGFTAGVLGQRVETMLKERGVKTDFVPVGGETRLNTIIIGEQDKTHTTITTSSLEVEPHHIDVLRTRFLLALEDASCVVMGGTLPAAMKPAFYTEFILLAHQKNVPVIFDADEPNLSAGLQSSPDYIKPNQHELERLMGETINTLDEAYAAGKLIQAKYHTSPIITMGEQGLLAILPDKTLHIPPLQVEVVSAAGAGDAVLAGLASAHHHGQSIEEGLRLGVAAATAVLLQPGTADCRKEDIDRFLPQVKIQSYP